VGKIGDGRGVGVEPLGGLTVGGGLLILTGVAVSDHSGGSGSSVGGGGQSRHGATLVGVGSAVCVGSGDVGVGGGGGHVAVGGTPVAGGVGDEPTTGVGVGPITSFRGGGIFSPGGAETFPHLRWTYNTFKPSGRSDLNVTSQNGSFS